MENVFLAAQKINIYPMEYAYNVNLNVKLVSLWIHNVHHANQTINTSKIQINV